LDSTEPETAIEEIIGADDPFRAPNGIEADFGGLGHPVRRNGRVPCALGPELVNSSNSSFDPYSIQIAGKSTRPG